MRIFHSNWNGLHESYKVDGFGKYAYAPATVYDKGVFHQFYCSTGARTDNFFNPEGKENLNKSWDHIRYRTSKDGVNWSTPRVVMTVDNNYYGRCACDPSIVYGDDNYWYMLYTGNVEGYETVVFLARSEYIQGPYFKYVGNGWEDDDKTNVTRNPKIMLGEENPKEYGVGQQTVVKIPGKNGSFKVWFRDGDGLCRYASVSKLTDLNMENMEEYKEATYFDKKGKKHRFKDEHYVFGEVRLNKDIMEKSGRPYFEMWCPLHYFAHETLLAKFTSENGIEWLLEDEDVLGVRGGKYRYSYIHNIGVSGDKYGRVEGGKYIVSFAAPSPGWSADASKVLNACVDSDYENFMKPFGIACNYELTKSEGFNIVGHRSNGEDMGGNWSMWQVLVGRDWFTNTINYDPNGTTFPEGPGVNSYAQLDYFTGDYDGDGIADLGAVNRRNTPNTWFIRSGRTGEYLYRNEVFVENMDKNYEIIAGDYDGDGKTDIGAVNKTTGQWFIRSSEEGNRMGIGSSPSSSNWIPWGWTWGGMDASFKIVVGDYDGDGKADRAIYKAPFWYIISSLANDYAVANGLTNVYGVSIPFGWYWVWSDLPRVAPTYMDEYDVVLPGDLDGDGITDRVVYEPEYGQWSALSSKSGNPVKWHCGRNCADEQWFRFDELFTYRPFYLYQNTKPFVGDYDGDGVDDLVQVDFSSGDWYIERSSDRKKGAFDDNPTVWKKFKEANRPEVLVGDFDGDGRADRAFADRQTHKFYVISSRKKEDWGVEGVNVEIKSAFKNNASKSWSYFTKSAAEKPIDEPKVAPVVPKAPSMDVSVSDRKISVSNVENGSGVTVFNMLGKKIFGAVVDGGSVNFELPSRGKFIVRSGAQSRVIVVK